MLSIVVPVYNARNKMHRTLESLRSIREHVPDHEVIFVDDCSNDGSYEYLSAKVKDEPNWYIFRTEHNSGSAAAPRNLGIEHARGEYLFFLDSDDEIICDGFAAAYNFGVSFKSDVVRTTLLLESPDGQETVANRVPQWAKKKSKQEKIAALVRHQSLTSSAFVKRELLLVEDIRFPENLRIGEDLLFSSKVLSVASKIDHRDKPAFKYIRHKNAGSSVTQSLKSNDFRDFLISWELAEEALAPVAVSFLEEHGFAALNYALRQYLWTKAEVLSERDFLTLSDFCKDHWEIISSYPLPPRLFELVRLALERNYEEFCAASTLRVLIAGHDLKFVAPIVDLFSEKYTVLIDKWEGHSVHDESQSRALLERSDYIWVEWLLGAAVWYSKEIKNHQKLVVRTHRTEMTADYGLQVCLDKVDKFIAIAPHTLADFADRFDIPRSQFRLIPNGFDIESYAQYPIDNRLHKIAMVGIVPKLKGFHRALRLLSRLREKHSDCTLSIYGKRPDEYDWVMRDEKQRDYYAACERFIDVHGLRDAIEYCGWADLRTEIGQYGFVLSLSDLEGMQVSPGEAYCAGALGVFRDWRGASECYPDEFVFHSEDEMLDFISLMQNPQEYERASFVGREFMLDNYSWEVVGKDIFALMDELQRT